MGNVKKFVAERTSHKRLYDRRVNKRKMQTQESKVDMGKALDVDLVVKECSRIESEVKSNEAKIKRDIDEIETINIELKHSVAKLLTKNERLHKENEHLKQTYKELYDSIKMTRVQTKDHTDSLIVQLNNKSTENADLKAQIQEKEVNSCKVTNRNSNKPIEQKSHTEQPGRHIFIGHRFSPNKFFAMYEKTSHRSDLRWKPMGKILNIVGFRWIPPRKLFDSYTGKVDSEPLHGSNVDIFKIYECKQTQDLSACTLINVQKKQSIKLGVELESIFGPLFDIYFNGENQVVSKSSAVTNADASNKRQQQPDSTSSTSTLAKIVSADGNFDL
nr:reverse transcriptase zinc-binding domain-containing protein [Tanacetum cinerariifolium]